MDKAKIMELTAVCGIDCFNCEMFETNIDAFFDIMAEDKKAMFASRGMTKENLRCKGCRGGGGGCSAIGGKCETLECVKKKGVEFCFECADFPCSKLQPLADRAKTAPHNLKVYNLMAIKNRGLEAWAAETKQIRKKYYEGKFKIGAGPQI